MKVEELYEGYTDWYYVMVYGPPREEIAEVVRAYEGDNESESWYLVLKMKDGQWCHVTAWCDYTGWGCQEGGDHYFASSEEELVRTRIDQSGRRLLGYEDIPESLL